MILEPPPPIVQEEEPWEDLRVTVFFEPDMVSYDPKYEKALNMFSEAARQHKDIQIQIEGNCATLFSNNVNKQHKEINYNLSLRRAQAIADYLKDKGVSAERLLIVGNGSDKHLKENASIEGRKLNRRVDVFFVK